MSALSAPAHRDVNANWTLEKRYYDEAGYGLSKGRRTRAEGYVSGALNNTIATTYDARGRVTLDRRSIGGANYDTQATYDSANRTLTSTLPTGEVLTPGYNSLGQPYALSGSQAYVNAAFYNYLGKPSEVRYANGLSQYVRYYGINESNQYAGGNPRFGRVRQLCVADTSAEACHDLGPLIHGIYDDGTTNTKLNLTYDYDNLGNVTAIGDRSSGFPLNGAGVTVHSYAYDDLNRLVSGSATGGEFPNFASTWSFDALGNMTNKAGMIQGYPASGPNSVRPHAVITTSC